MLAFQAACITLLSAPVIIQRCLFPAALSRNVSKKRQQQPKNIHNFSEPVKLDAFIMTAMAEVAHFEWWTEAFFQKKKRNEKNDGKRTKSTRPYVKQSCCHSNSVHTEFRTKFEILFQCFNTCLWTKVIFVVSHAYFCMKKNIRRDQTSFLTWRYKKIKYFWHTYTFTIYEWVNLLYDNSNNNNNRQTEYRKTHHETIENVNRLWRAGNWNTIRWNHLKWAKEMSKKDGNDH